MTAPKTVILIIEDEQPIRRFLRASLHAQGYEVVEAGRGREALGLAASHNPDLVLVDLGLPDMDGSEVIAKIREWSQVPIIVLTARFSERDKISVLDAGADDYLTKPFSVNELLARVRVSLRRKVQAQTGAASPILTAGPLKIDVEKTLITLDGKEVRVTPIEYKLLVELCKHVGRVLTHEHLIRAVWGQGHAEDSSYLRVHIHQLRRKISREGKSSLLKTEAGFGYRLLEDDEPGSTNPAADE